MPRPLHEVAKDVRANWGKVNYAAEPYLIALASLSSINDKYGADDAKSIVLYFLSNASTFRGPVAKALKAELKAIAGVK